MDTHTEQEKNKSGSDFNLEDLEINQLLAHIFSGGTMAQLEGYTQNSLNAMYEVGKRFYNAGRYLEAQHVFHELVRLNHLEQRYMFSLAACMQKRGEYISAANTYLSAATLKPNNDNIEISFYLAQCLIKAGKSLDQAKTYLEYVIERCPAEGPLSEMKSIAQTHLSMLNKSNKKAKKSTRS